MNLLLVLIITLCSTVNNVARKAYNQSCPDKGSYTFTTLIAVTAALFFVLSSGGSLSFSMGLLPWSAAFGISYGLAIFFSVLAVSCGSLALTSLIISYSLILPTLFGLIFYQEPVSMMFLIGMLLLMLSLLLINGSSSKLVITLRWCICVLISFLANGTCSIIQAAQQRHFNGAFKNEFMILALAIVSVVLIAFTLVKEKQDISSCLKSGLLYGGICGITNGIVNLLSMVLVTRMNVSIVFPIISAGCIVAVSAVSVLYYKEQLSRKQLTGLALGVGAIVFLSF